MGVLPADEALRDMPGIAPLLPAAAPCRQVDINDALTDCLAATLHLQLSVHSLTLRRGHAACCVQSAGWCPYRRRQNTSTQHKAWLQRPCNTPCCCLTCCW